MTTQDEKQVLLEAEKIMEAADANLMMDRLRHENQVMMIEKMASITHVQAHMAMDSYTKSMTRAAKTANMDPQAFIDSMPKDQNFLVLGMCIGGVLAGGELEFDLDSDKPQPDHGQ